MKFLINFVIIASLMVLDVFALPQTYSELANAAKQTEQLYYSMDAPNLLPFENSYDKDNGRVEHEGYGSKIDSIYDGFHKKSAEIFNPQPVVDGIHDESEKDGNDGNQYGGVKTLITSVMSVVSNLVNKLVDIPGNAVTGIVQGANRVLNQVGGKVVGLQK